MKSFSRSYTGEIGIFEGELDALEMTKPILILTPEEAALVVVEVLRGHVGMPGPVGPQGYCVHHTNEGNE